MGEEVKRLYRSREERMLGGVCGGLAEYLSVDPTLIRILFIVFAFAGGPGLLAYIIMLFVVPEEPVE
jgi:phage shock protein C